MLPRSFRAFVSLWLLVNAITGSPRSFSSDETQRHPRHASCPSCRRERPDALVSWAIPPRRDYRDLDSEAVPWRGRQQSYRSDPFLYPSQYGSSDEYGRAFRSRGGPAAIDRPTDTCKRENPFGLGRRFNFNVAPAQAASAYNTMRPVTPFSPRQSANPRSSPLFGRPNFYDTINRHRPNVSPVNRYYYNTNTNNNDHGGVETFEGTKRYVDRGASMGSQQGFRVIYRADKRHRDEDYEDETPMIAQQQYPRTPFSRARETSVGTRQEDRYVQQPRRQSVDFGSGTYERRVKPYGDDGSQDSNGYTGTMRDIEREPITMAMTNDTEWNHRMAMQDQAEEEEVEEFGPRRVEENREETDAGTVETMNNVRRQNNGQFDFRDEEPRGEEEVKEKRPMTSELSKTSEEQLSTQLAIETTEKVTKSSPPIMQIPRRVTVSA